MKQFLLAAMMATMWAGAIPALAAEGADGGKVQPDRQARREQWCKANPEKCKELQARQAQCKADPEKCRAERQAKMKERQAQCKADPDKCKAERQARREQFCKNNPERCSQMKARMEERRKQCEANPAQCRPDKGPKS